MLGGFIVVVMVVRQGGCLRKDLMYDVFRGKVDDLVLKHDQRGPGKRQGGFGHPNKEAGVPTANPAHDYQLSTTYHGTTIRKIV